MQDYGLVSIITPSYNSAEIIGATIESIIAQTYPDWELLITDDCSTDNSVEVIERYAIQDSRIKLFRLDKNSGAGVARNKSIEMAAGRFIAFCDSDDMWYPYKLERQLAFMSRMGCIFSYTSYMTCDEAGDTKGIVVCRHRETYSSLKRDDKIGCLTMIYDTQKIGKVFMSELRWSQDWAFKLKVLSITKEAYGMKEPLALYRVRRDSLSRDKWAMTKGNIAVYKEILGWSALKAWLFFLFVFMPCYVFKKMMLRYINS